MRVSPCAPCETVSLFSTRLYVLSCKAPWAAGGGRTISTKSAIQNPDGYQLDWYHCDTSGRSGPVSPCPAVIRVRYVSSVCRHARFAHLTARPPCPPAALSTLTVDALAVQPIYSSSPCLATPPRRPPRPLPHRPAPHPPQLVRCTRRSAHQKAPRGLLRSKDPTHSNGYASSKCLLVLGISAPRGLRSRALPLSPGDNASPSLQGLA